MSLSLTKSLNQAKVNIADAERVQSHYIQDPLSMSCPMWNGQDTVGRNVHEFSFMTKKPGCNSPNDRILQENLNRPQYLNFISSSGVRSIGDDLYSRSNSQAMAADARSLQSRTLGLTSGRFDSESSHIRTEPALFGKQMSRKQTSSLRHQASTRSKFPSQEYLANPSGDYTTRGGAQSYATLESQMLMREMESLQSMNGGVINM